MPFLFRQVLQAPLFYMAVEDMLDRRREGLSVRLRYTLKGPAQVLVYAEA
jgi:hypothetical protein